MKKSFFFLVLGALILASVTSCQKDPQTQALKDKKISTISYSDQYMQMRTPLANFNWSDKDLLKTIEVMNDQGAVEIVVNFTYENNLVSRMDCYQYQVSMGLKYLDKKLNELTLCLAEDTIATGTVSFDENKVDMLTVTIYDVDKLQQCTKVLNALAVVVPQPLQQPMAEFMHQVVASNQSKYNLVVNAQFTWESDNVTKIFASGGGMSLNASLNYDTKTNPLYGFMSLFGCSFPKNNPTQATATYEGEQMMFMVTYQYDEDDYPTQLNGFMATDPTDQTVFYIDYK